VCVCVCVYYLARIVLHESSSQVDFRSNNGVLVSMWMSDDTAVGQPRCDTDRSFSEAADAGEVIVYVMTAHECVGAVILVFVAGQTEDNNERTTLIAIIIIT